MIRKKGSNQTTVVGQRRQPRRVSAAAAYATGTDSGQAQIRATRDSCRVVHRELVTSISGGGTSAFTVAATLILNPGINATFQWLSSLATNWEMYRFNSLRVRYLTRCGTGTAGSVLLAPDYDAADPAPSTEQVASSFLGTVEDSPWKDLTLNLRPAEMHALGPKKFVRSVALAANLDIKTYDAGNVFICTVDSGAAAGWGKIWIEYDVTFYSPQTNPQALNSLFLHISGVTPTTTSLLGTQTEVSSSLTIPASVSNEFITFLVAGTYLITYNVSAATSVTEASAPVVGAGGALITSYNTNGYTSSGSGTVNMTRTILMSAIVGSTLVIDDTIVGGTFAQIYFVQVPSAAV